MPSFFHTMKLKGVDIISFLIILITITSVNQWSTFRYFFQENSSKLVIYFVTLSLIIGIGKFYFSQTDKKSLRILYLYIIWIVICILRGVFVADNRAEWINLLTFSFTLLMPIISYTATNPDFDQKILAAWFKYIIPIYLVFVVFFMHLKVSGFFLYFFTILLVSYAALPEKWKWTSVLCFLIMLVNIDARSHVIKYGIALIFGLMFYLRSFFSAKTMNMLRGFFLIFPVIMFLLGISGVFNIFKIGDYLEGEFLVTSERKGEIVKENIFIDSRTFLYEEVINSAIDNDYILFGRTPARGNDTKVFTFLAQDVFASGKEERPANEVGILNLFTWTGLTGVVLFFLVFITASHLAINRSNNFFMRIVGLYVSFRWMYCWVEDVYNFNLMTIALWIMIAMCFSNSFRMMSDDEFIIWVRGIFNRKKADSLKNTI